MHKPPKVSVIIPTYNGAGFIGETIDSVLEQTYQDFELIVVDDGSTDETHKVLNSYGDKLKICSQANRGVTAARNAGIQAASGELIAFLDHDDLWEKEKLTCQVPLLDAEPTLGVCFSNYSWFGQEAPYASGFDEVGRRWERLAHRKIGNDGYTILCASLLMEFILNGTNPCLTSTMILRREALERVGFYYEGRGIYGDERQDRFPEDVHLYLRLAKYVTFGYVDRVLVKRHLRDSWFASRPDDVERSILKGTIEMLDSLHEWIPLSATEARVVRERIAGYYLNAGYFEFSHDSFVSARRELARSLSLKFSWNACFYFISSFLPVPALQRLRSMKQATASLGHTIRA